jgi:outer membrane protein
LPCHAANLIEAYRDALQSDPTFKSAEAQKFAIQQSEPIARGAFFPKVSAIGAADRLHNDQTFGGTDNSFHQTIQRYALNANQIIFDYASWGRLQNAKAQVKQAQAAFNAAQQDLMIRLAGAYFSVLNAYDTLVSTQAEKRSLAEQLRQTEEQFKVGLIAVTDVDQVRANHDIVAAREIAQQNDVSDKLEGLRAITGVFYKKLAAIKGSAPLIPPTPNNINEWVKVTEKQNYTLLAARFAAQAAKENIKIQSAGHYPVVGAEGSYSYTDQSATQFFLTGTNSAQTDRIAKVTVNAQLPIFSGGTVTAQTRQASYQYAQAVADMDFTYRSVLTKAREAFLGVISGISKIKADKQAIASNQSSLNATRAGYAVGTNTLLDVLIQQTALYNAQTNFTTDQYTYLIDILRLKQAAGILSVQDLELMNTWLKDTIDLANYYYDADITRPTPW